MSFKWPGTPSPRPREHELADYAELVAWQHGMVSLTEVSRVLGRLAENDYSAAVGEGDPVSDIENVSGGVPEEDEVDQLAEDAFTELDRRVGACGPRGYPYKIAEQGYTLRIRTASSSPKHLLYCYLLLATRLNMTHNRHHADMDGTLLFEGLAAAAAQDYLGPRAESMVFGTSADAPNFKAKVNRLCECIEEGGMFRDRLGGQTSFRDGKLDIVAWKPFADRRPGKLIAFGQCKTGTSYKDSLTQLQPDSFLRKWVLDPPLFTPVRMFFLSEALPTTDWKHLASDAGLLFDRCRVVEFANGVDDATVRRITAWTSAAAKANQLPPAASAGWATRPAVPDGEPVIR